MIRQEVFGPDETQTSDEVSSAGVQPIIETSALPKTHETRRTRKNAFVAASVGLAALLGPKGCDVTPASSSSSFKAIFKPVAAGSGGYTYAGDQIGANIYYCGNVVNGEIVDHIMRRNAYNKQVSVLEPTPGSWDSVHTCDPSVLKGNFNLDGTQYQWAMFYTGNAVPNSAFHNDLGVAFSNDTINWVKTGVPLISRNPGEETSWGVGQPTATSIDGNGQILLSYTRGEHAKTAAYATAIDLSNVRTPDVLKEEWELKNSLGIHNQSMAYDATHDRFVVAGQTAADFREAVGPNYITDSITVMTIPAADFWEGNDSWQVVSVIGDDERAARTKKVHNPGLIKNEFGALVDPNNAEVLITFSPNYTANRDDWQNFQRSLFNYRMAKLRIQV